jgi:hypothetical protein
MKQQVFWIPNQATIKEDEDDLARMVERRYHEITADMNANGYHHMIWDDWKPSHSRSEVGEWLESRDHMKSYISPVLRVCYGFKKPCDALLFKLTWGGR